MKRFLFVLVILFLAVCCGEVADLIDSPTEPLNTGLDPFGEPDWIFDYIDSTGASRGLIDIFDPGGILLPNTALVKAKLKETLDPVVASRARKLNESEADRLNFLGVDFVVMAPNGEIDCPNLVWKVAGFSHISTCAQGHLEGQP